ncbi:alpha/beta hydrolase [Billgrantia desiderata]|uniref:alpha/beta fold hydrolase n=1 Tax=Billgrantia desiderata TaxID=52021 RepID=UPI0030B84F91
MCRSREALLIGHSMGGTVAVEAARLMPERVIGIVGVDTFHHVAPQMSQSDLEQMLTPMQEDFANAARHFVSTMFIEETNPALPDWIIRDMTAAVPDVALSAFEDMGTRHIDGEAAQHFEELTVPVVAINADLWPTDVEANRQLLPEFDAVIVEGSDHFLHMAKPAEFNRELDRVIGTPP